MKNEQPTHLDLFSGIGGFALAAQWAGFRTIGFCEIDKYCQKVLAKNFLADAQFSAITPQNNGWKKHQREGSSMGQVDSSSRPRLFGNIFDLDGRDFYGVTLITGGFPCQPFSVAGKRRGAADDRAIWPEMFRVIKEARPAWVLGENVPGIIPMELDNVLSDLEGIGYATRAFVIPACAVDARHRRDRLWILARRRSGWRCPIDDSENRSREEIGDNATNLEYAELAGLEGHDAKEQSKCNRKWASSITRETGSPLADTERGGQPRQGQPINAINSTPTGNRQAVESFNGGESCVWLPEPDVGRVAHGIPAELDFIRRLEDETIYDKEAVAEINPIIRQILRTMWECQELAATSPDIYRSLLRDLVPEMPYERSQNGWLLGKRIKEDKELCDLWKRFYSAAQQEEQNLQCELLERIGKTKRPQTLGSRVDRLKALGNAIVPQVAYEILREIRKLC